MTIGILADDLTATLRLRLEEAGIAVYSQDVVAMLEAIPDAFSDVEEAIQNGMVEAGRAGADVAAGIMENNFGVSVSRTGALSDVRQWIDAHLGDFMATLYATTATRVNSVYAGWLAQALPIEELKRAILGDWAFSGARAEAIGVTETTRLYNLGKFVVWEGAGLNPPPRDVPPAHPSCRCWTGIQIGQRSLEYLWYTAVDSRVCPICAPRHLEVIGDAGPLYMRR